ncbi:MAG: response regulator transcription factor [Chloroflexi bacterium]|nr:response regulator transcription factor [Chloroflexota bacterium]
MNEQTKVCQILIVDDVPAVRESLRWLLQDEHDLSVVGEATNGAQALERVAELKPQVVILDIELPDQDGYAVARQLKQLPHPPTIVFLSIHGDADSRERARLAGADGFVAKGDGSTALVEHIRAAVGGRTSHERS